MLLLVLFIKRCLAKKAATVLGVSMVAPPRKPPVEEIKRQSKAYTVARRIAVLPDSKKFKVQSSCCQYLSILTPQCPADFFFSLAGPLARRSAMLFPATRAVPFRDCASRWSRLFLTGHCSDLCFVSSMKCMKANKANTCL